MGKVEKIREFDDAAHTAVPPATAWLNGCCEGGRLSARAPKKIVADEQAVVDATSIFR
jgi:hypothetical protein